jgi:hypothetical protein
MIGTWKKLRLTEIHNLQSANMKLKCKWQKVMNTRKISQQKPAKLP